jgi:hypothetical protein
LGADRVKINVKGNGQECPFHTSQVKSNVNSGCCRRLWFPPFAKDAKDGAPSSDEGTDKVKSKVKGNGQECLSHTGKVNVKGERCGRLCVPPLRQALGCILSPLCGWGLWFVLRASPTILGAAFSGAKARMYL